MPVPLAATVMQARRCFVAALMVIVPPLGVCSMALASRFEKNLSEPAKVGIDGDWCCNQVPVLLSTDLKNTAIPIPDGELQVTIHSVDEPIANAMFEVPKDAVSRWRIAIGGKRWAQRCLGPGLGRAHSRVQLTPLPTQSGPAVFELSGGRVQRCQRAHERRPAEATSMIPAAATASRSPKRANGVSPEVSSTCAMRRSAP